MNQHRRAVAAILAVDVFWGLNAVFSKIAFEEVPLLTFLGLRTLTATLVLGFLFRKNFVRPPLKLIFLAFLGGPVVFYGAWSGIQLSSATSIALVGATNPSFYFIFSVLFLREKFDIHKFAGVLLVVAGAALGAFAVASSGSGVWYGPVIIFFFYGLGAAVDILIKKLTKDRPDIDSKFIAWLYMMLISIVLLPAALLFDEPVDVSAVSTAALSAWIFSVVSLVVAFGLLFFYAVKRLDGEDFGLFRGLEPVVVALGGVFILNEQLTWHFWVGAALIATGLLIAELHISPYNILRHFKKH